MRILTLLAAFAALPASAGVPLVLKQHARLLNADDAPFSGAAQVTIELFDSDSPSASAVWSETYGVTVFQGVYELEIGGAGGDPLDPADFAGPLWMDVKISDEKLAPRMRIASVPYALSAEEATHAASADVAAGLAGAAFAGTGSATTAARSDHTHELVLDAYADLVAKDKIGEAAGKIAAGIHTHAVPSYSHDAADVNAGALATDRFSAYADLGAEAKIGDAAGQLAAGNHAHASLSLTDLTASNFILAGTAVTGGCTSAGRLAYDGTAKTLYFCDGSAWVAVGGLGTIQRPAASCQALKNAGRADGVYWINPAGRGPIPVFCEMDDAAGGWTLAVHMNHPGRNFRPGMGTSVDDAVDCTTTGNTNDYCLARSTNNPLTTMVNPDQPMAIPYARNWEGVGITPTAVMIKRHDTGQVVHGTVVQWYGFRARTDSLYQHGFKYAAIDGSASSIGLTYFGSCDSSGCTMQECLGFGTRLALATGYTDCATGSTYQTYGYGHGICLACG